ncbi:MAG: tRNA pseudouridine(55) synthase TruB, partial [Usitatibacteraceae bacterium]
MKTERRLPATPRELDGVLLLDKPAGRSSTQAMSAAKRIFRVQKAGHTGTLDPFATGLLPVCFGEATKFSRFMLDAEKSYRATLKLGEVSTTGDTEGVIQRSGPVEVDGARAAAVLEQFVGDQTQIPPMYSALKQAGVPLYELARKGIEVERAARHIHIYAIELISLSGSELVIDVDVSKGTYIRVLAEDIGKQLGCGAHLTAL